MKDKIPVAIIGSGNIGTDLMFKIEKSKNLKLICMAGIDPSSKGLALAKEHGYKITVNGIEGLLETAPEAAMVFDATSAHAHVEHAPLLEEAGKIAIDLTPAAVGPFVVPVVNMDEHLDKRNVNMLSCGGQATIPIVFAVSRVAEVRYGEIVSTVASKSAGPGTRQNLDEFTDTTSKGIELVGKAKRGKAIAILNPAHPPILMTNTIYVEYEGGDARAIRESVYDIVAQIQEYVPGYRFRTQPIIDDNLVTVIVEVEGSGDYLEKYAGNLDIMTASAVKVGERMAETLM